MEGKKGKKKKLGDTVPEIQKEARSRRAPRLSARLKKPHQLVSHAHKEEKRQHPKEKISEDMMDR